MPPRFFEDFSSVSAADDDAGTTLHADLADMAELHGLLDALRRDGLALVEVRREQVPHAVERETTDTSRRVPPLQP